MPGRKEYLEHPGGPPTEEAPAIGVADIRDAVNGGPPTEEAPAIGVADIRDAVNYLPHDHLGGGPKEETTQKNEISPKELLGSDKLPSFEVFKIIKKGIDSRDDHTGLVADHRHQTTSDPHK